MTLQEFANLYELPVVVVTQKLQELLGYEIFSDTIESNFSIPEKYIEELSEVVSKSFIVCFQSKLDKVPNEIAKETLKRFRVLKRRREAYRRNRCGE